MHHFSAATRRALARKGISIVGLTVIPGQGDMSWANGSTGYQLDDNGCHRIRSFTEVLELAR